MTLVAFRRLARAAVALGLLAAPARAQTYGQPFQPGSQSQPGYGPDPGHYSGEPQTGVLSLVGTWSGFSTGSAGLLQQSEAFSADGKFVTVSRQASGLIGRYWGFYRVTPIGPNQFRLETQLQGFLPRESCSQVPGSPMNCHTMQLPPYQVMTVTFTSPNQVSMTNGVSEQRDDQPMLLQAQAPERWVTMLQSPAPAPAPAPVAPSYRPSYSSRPTPYRNGCPSDDGQTALCKYSGRLVPSGGCLRCVD